MPADAAVVTKGIFLVCFSVSISQVLRVAHDWLPFTPSYTSVDKKWVGFPDILRWLLSGIFLFPIIPLLYLWFVQVHLSSTPAPIIIPMDVPNIEDVIKFMVLITLCVPLLGFYDIWQSIVRTWPSIFYSDKAIQIIEQKFPSAFSAGQVITLLIGLFWIMWPLLGLYLVRFV